MVRYVQIYVFLFFFNKIQIFRNIEKVFLGTLTIHMIPKFCLFRPISNRFWDKCKFNFFVIFKIFGMLKNVLLWTKIKHVIPKFRPFRSITIRFWDKCKFKILFFLKWPPFSQLWTNYCQKLIRASFKYTGCSYKILNHFI